MKHDGEAKYPIFDRKSAESALRLINHARPPLTPAQRAAVIRRAAKYGVRPADDDKDSKKRK